MYKVCRYCGKLHTKWFGYKYHLAEFARKVVPGMGRVVGEGQQHRGAYGLRQRVH